MKIQHLVIPCFSIFFAFISDSAAQERDTLTAELGEIEVEATYSNITLEDAPFAISAISRSTFDRNTTPGLTLSEITARVPGIWVNQRENFALGERVTIRGMGWRAAFGVRGIQVVLDGIPITVADGQSMLDVIDPAMIQSLEVLRGPASTLWGNSSGGVLYVKTMPPVNQNIRFRTQGGSFGLTKNELQISRSLGNHFISGYTTMHVEDGFRNHSAVTLSRSALNGRFVLSENTILSANSAFSIMPRAKNPGSLTKTQLNNNAAQARSNFKEVDAGKQVTQGQIGLRLQHNFNDRLQLESSLYGILRDLRNPLPFAFIDLNRKAGGLRNLLRTNSERWSFAAGTEIKFQFDDRANFNTIDGERGNEVLLRQDERVLSEAIFGKIGYKRNNWSLRAGLRLDALQFNNDDQYLENGDQSGDESFTSLSPSLGFNYHINNQTFFTNLSTAFEVPTTTELVNRPDGLGGFNSQLEPENIRSIETGMRGRLIRWPISYDAAFYSMWIDDLLLPFQTPGSDRTFFRNEGKSRHTGAEFVLNADISKNLKGLVNYNWTFAQFREGVLDGSILDGNRIPGITPHRLFTELTFQIKKMILTAGLRYVDSFHPDSQNNFNVDNYTLLHAKAAIDNLKLSSNIFASPYLVVNNITDKTHSSSVSVNARGNRFFEPGADLNVEVGLSLTFN